jgi:hypothetical protein
LGYGLYGTGIASAEEVLLAVAERENQTSAEPSAASEATASEPSDTLPEGPPPSERQLAFVRNLLEQVGTPEEEIETRVDQVATRQEASLLINQLRAQLRTQAA